MFYGYGLLNNHTPTLRATTMRGGSSPYLTNLYAVYKGESNTNDSLSINNGTARGGLTYTAGKSGNGFVFNGTTSSVDLPNGTLSSLGTSFSYSFWIKPSIITGISCMINTYTSTGGSKGFYTRYTSGGAIETYAFNSGGSAIINGAGGGTITSGTWQMVTITFDGSNIRTYKNGTLQNTTAYSGVIAFDTTTYPSIGSLYYAPATYAYFVNGSMDEVYFWTKKLSDAEVTELYNSGTGKFYPTF